MDFFKTIRETNLKITYNINIRYQFYVISNNTGEYIYFNSMFLLSMLTVSFRNLMRKEKTYKL